MGRAWLDKLQPGCATGRSGAASHSSALATPGHYKNRRNLRGARASQDAPGRTAAAAVAIGRVASAESPHPPHVLQENLESVAQSKARAQRIALK